MTILSNGISEEGVFFSCGEQTLAGVFTSPSEPNGHAVLIEWGAGTLPSSGPNQVRTRMARALAADGYHCLRFDHMGVGESTGEYDPPTLSTPFIEQIVAATTLLETRGLERITLVGNCFGAWSCLMAAPSVPGLEGLVMSGPPVRRNHYQARGANASMRFWVRGLKGLKLSKLKNARHRNAYRQLVKGKLGSLAGVQPRDTRFVDAMQGVFERGVPSLLIHQDDAFGADLVAELDHGLRDAINDAPPPTRVVALDGYIPRNFSAQSSLIEDVRRWLSEVRMTESRQTV